MQKRIEWLDLTKVLTMFFVIFDHLGLRNSHVSDWVWLFHLPTFFLISGIFYKQPHSFLIGLKKDTLRLLLPVVIWWVVGMITWQPFFYFYFHKHEFWNLYTRAITDFFSGYHMSFGWFMIALFLMKVEMFFLNKLKLWMRYLIALILIPLGAWCLKYLMDGLLPFYLTNSLAAFPFFFVGHLMSDKIKGLSLKNISAIVIMTICFITTIILLPHVGHVSLNAVEYGNGIGWMYVAGLIGSLMIIMFSYSLKYISKHHVINILGGGTVVLLLFQPPFLYLFKKLYKVLFHIQISGAYFDTISAAVATLLIMMLMYPAIVWINKHIPILNGLTKKVR